jgi:hypothetical protein
MEARRSQQALDESGATIKMAITSRALAGDKNTPLPVIKTSTAQLTGGRKLV